MKLVYIAGKYRGKNTNEIWHHINLSRFAAEQIALRGDMPVSPHLNTAFMDGIQDDQFWLDGTKRLLEVCDAIYLLPNWKESVGAKAEWRRAKELKIPRYRL